MRLALLSAIDNAPSADAQNPCFAMFAGSMVIEHQLDLCIRMDCTGILCLIENLSSEITRLQRRAERAGVSFRTIRRPAQLIEAVRSEDEIMVLAHGVLPDGEAVAAQIAEPCRIAAFPADRAIENRYERIDRAHLWAGVMLVTGKQVDNLPVLPEDIDVPSTLLRVALQEGCRLVSLDLELLAEQRWHARPDRAALQMREKAIVDALVKPISFQAPGLAVAERAGARVVRDIIGRPLEPAPTIAAIGCAAAALAAGMAGWPVFGLLLATVAALLSHFGRIIERLAVQDASKKPKRMASRLGRYALDPIFIALLVLASPTELGSMRLFAPLMLFGLLLLGERHGSTKWRATYADRVALGALLTLAALFGLAMEAAMVLALTVLATRFYAPFRDK